MSTIPERTDRFTLIPSLYILLRRDGKILLMRRANTEYMNGMYCVVAGHLEAGESAREGAAREAKEEVGVTIKPENLRLVHVGHRFKRSRIDFFFEATEWEGEPTNMEPNLCDDLSWFPEDNLPDNVIPYVRLVLDNIAKGQAYTEDAEEI